MIHRAMIWGFVVSFFCLLAINHIFSAEVSMKSKNDETSTTPIVSIIPKPARISFGDGFFTIKPDTIIMADEEVQKEAEYLAGVLQPAMGLGFALKVQLRENMQETNNSIILKIDPLLNALGDEGYKMSVSSERVIISGAKPAGVFYGCQTLRQMMPIENFGDKKAEGVDWKVPCAEIEDQPRFEWRGQLFDCCRHFFSVDTVKRAIDLLALHKMNRLHWHLTEDQGWRVEIKKYPKLTEVGAWRIENDGSRYGGFYTQKEMREIVEYASARHIMVVPEIEMPGHSTAALASYPHLGCTGGPYKVANSWGVFTDVYCAGNEDVFRFIEDVLTEVLDIFHSPYIHIGGDECPKDAWKKCSKCQARIQAENLKDEHELQSYFIKRIDKFLTGKGRRLIGWDEILEGGLSPNAVVQSWRGIKGGIESARQSHDVIMSPTTHCYLDYDYTSISVEKSYLFEPVPSELTEKESRHILGLEGNIWAERVSNQDRLDFQLYPRLTALSEVGWSPKAARDWNDFDVRLNTHLKRLELLGVKYGKDEMGPILQDAQLLGHWSANQMKMEGVELEWDATPFIKDAGKYHVIFFYKKGASALQIEWAALLENGKEIQRDTHQGWSGAVKRDIVFTFLLPERAAGAAYAIRAFGIPQGDEDSNGDVLIKFDE